MTSNIMPAIPLYRNLLITHYNTVPQEQPTILNKTYMELDVLKAVGINFTVTQEGYDTL